MRGIVLDAEALGPNTTALAMQIQAVVPNVPRLVLGDPTHTLSSALTTASATDRGVAVGWPRQAVASNRHKPSQRHELLEHADIFGIADINPRWRALHMP